jgi:hypothetical protein
LDSDPAGDLHAFVYRVTDGLDINREVVARGFAPADGEWAGTRGAEFRALAEQARQQQRGLWAAPAPTQPDVVATAAMPGPPPALAPEVAAFYASGFSGVTARPGAASSPPAGSGPAPSATPLRIVPEAAYGASAPAVASIAQPATGRDDRSRVVDSKPPASDPTVCVTAGGTRYHRATCASLARSRPIEMPRSEALAKFTPCLRCRPDAPADAAVARPVMAADLPAAAPPQATAVEPGTSHLCGAPTKSGSPCKRRVVSGQFCYQHGG